MSMTIEERNAMVRAAVENRLDAQAAGKPHEEWYAECDMSEAELDEAIERLTADEVRLRGDGLLQTGVHPTSQAFFDLCDGLKEMHRRKSLDYGCPSGTDPLANIRNGAKFVGIPAWRAAMVRLSDKVTRLATFNATGTLHNEGVVDTLEDLASYSLLALLLYREEHGP